MITCTTAVLRALQWLGRYCCKLLLPGGLGCRNNPLNFGRTGQTHARCQRTGDGLHKA